MGEIGPQARGPTQTDPGRYCREVEAYLCRKNDGHLVRIVGPAFEKVSRWAAQGIPLKIVFRGIDRYFERYYRRGPRRFPVRIEFCESDVLDLFDEWRRTVGLVADRASEAAAARRPQRSLPSHLDRVLARLAVSRALVGTRELVAAIERVATEVDTLRVRATRIRGAERTAVLQRLAELDRELEAAARRWAAPDLVEAARREAEADLAAFRDRMPPEMFRAALERAIARELRERLDLPRLALEPGG